MFYLDGKGRPVTTIASLGNQRAALQTAIDGIVDAGETDHETVARFMRLQRRLARVRAEMRDKEN